MKVAAAKAIALLAREDVPDEVVSAYGGERPKYGKEYIIPSTFDPRLVRIIPSAVADAAMKSGVAKKKIDNLEDYKDKLSARLDPSMSLMQGINANVKKSPKTSQKTFKNMNERSKKSKLPQNMRKCLKHPKHQILFQAELLPLLE